MTGARALNALHRRARLLAVLGALLLVGCASPPPVVGPDLATIWTPSPNFSGRRPNFIIIHHTGSPSLWSALNTLTSAKAEVSAHYLIDKDGSLRQLVDERHRAWHAGDARWGANTDVNSDSIGIELVNSGNEPFPQAQIDTLLALVKDIVRRYHMPPENVIGHADVAPKRKVDPNRYFPWAQLAAQGLGLRCTRPLDADMEAAVDDRRGGVVAADADPLLGLQAIGYDMRDPRAAWIAFRRHFRPELPEQNPVIANHEELVALFDPTDRALIRCLVDAANAGRAAISRSDVPGR